MKSSPKSKTVSPRGQLEQLGRIDFGEGLMTYKGKDIEQIVERDVVFQIDENTFIRGDKIQRVVPENDFSPLTPYFSLNFQSFSEKFCSYSFDVMKNRLNAS